jgi:hypothetical protein
MSGYTQLRNAINYVKESKLVSDLQGYNKKLTAVDSVLNLLSHKTTNDCEEDKISVLNILKSIKGAKNYTNNPDIYKKNIYNERKINILYEGDSWLDYGPAIPTDLFNIDLKNRIIQYYNQNYEDYVTHLDSAKYGDVTGFMTMSDYKDESEFRTRKEFYDKEWKKKEEHEKREEFDKFKTEYKPFLKEIIDEHKIDILVFSGGGNDILAEYLNETLRVDVADKIFKDEIKEFEGNEDFFNYYIKYILSNEKKVEYDDIGKFCIAHQDKFDLERIFNRCVNVTEFDKKMSYIKEKYFDLINFVKSSRNPKTIILGHAYDYAVLRENNSLGIGANRPYKKKPEQDKVFGIKIGPWIKPYFDGKRMKSRSLRALVLIHMINRFKNVLLEVRDYALGEQVNFDFVDFHKTFFDSNYMTDEIHPSTIGSKYLFNHFNKKMLPAFLHVVSEKKLDIYKKKYL